MIFKTNAEFQNLIIVLIKSRLLFSNTIILKDVEQRMFLLKKKRNGKVQTYLVFKSH